MCLCSYRDEPLMILLIINEKMSYSILVCKLMLSCVDGLWYSTIWLSLQIVKTLAHWCMRPKFNEPISSQAQCWGILHATRYRLSLSWLFRVCWKRNKTDCFHLSSFSNDDNNKNNKNNNDDDDCNNSKKACLIETAGTLRHVLNICR